MGDEKRWVEGNAGARTVSHPNSAIQTRTDG
jgi:hypothetical protein